MLDYLEKNLPDPKTHKVYFDSGTATLDSACGPHRCNVDAIMQRRLAERVQVDDEKI